MLRYTPLKITGAKIFLIVLIVMILSFLSLWNSKITTKCHVLEDQTSMSIKKTTGLGPIILDSLTGIDLGPEGNKVRDEFSLVRAKILKDIFPKLDKEHETLTSEQFDLVGKYYSLGSSLVSLSHGKEREGKISLNEIEKQWNLYAEKVNQGLRTSCP